MKIWAINWASNDELDALMDDIGNYDVEVMAQPNGVLMATLDHMKIKELIDAEIREMLDNEDEFPDDAMVCTKASRPDDGYFVWEYGDYVICARLKEVM